MEPSWRKSESYIGVDVSKDHLDVAFPGARVWRTKNDAAGIAALARKAARLERPRLVCEATGGYTRALVQGMAQAAIPLSRVNPRQVRDFGLWPKFILSNAAGGVEGRVRAGGWQKRTCLTLA